MFRCSTAHINKKKLNMWLVKRLRYARDLVKIKIKRKFKPASSMKMWWFCNDKGSFFFSLFNQVPPNTNVLWKHGKKKTRYNKNYVISVYVIITNEKVQQS